MTHPLQALGDRSEAKGTARPGAASEALDSARQGAYGPAPKDAANQAKLDRIELLGLDAPDAIETVFQKNLSVWDKNQDKYVSKDELDAVRFDSSTARKADVAVWHAMRTKYYEIADLNNDEWGTEDDGITPLDIKKLQTLKDTGGKTSDEKQLVFDVNMAAFDAERALATVDPAGITADSQAARTQPEKVPTSYSSITRKGTDHFVYYEKENPGYPGVSYPSKGLRMISEPIMMGWPKEIHEFLTTQKGGRFNLPDADLEGLDVEALKKKSKDGKAFHQIEPGTVMDVVHNDDSMDRYYVPNDEWTVEQKAEARSYSQQGDFQRLYNEHLTKWDADKNGTLSRDEVLAHLDDKFQSRESAIFMGTMFENGPRMQHYADDKPVKPGTVDFEVSLDDARRLSYSFDDAVQSLRDGKKQTENKEWTKVSGTMAFFNQSISRAEIAHGGPTRQTTYRDLLKVAIEKTSLKK